MTKFKPKPQLCENCGEELTQEEIDFGEGWCFSCDNPNGDYYA